MSYLVTITATDRQESIWVCEDFESEGDSLLLRKPQQIGGKGFEAIVFPGCNMFSWAVTEVSAKASPDEPA